MLDYYIFTRYVSFIIKNTRLKLTASHEHNTLQRNYYKTSFVNRNVSQKCTVHFPCKSEISKQLKHFSRECKNIFGNNFDLYMSML